MQSLLRVACLVALLAVVAAAAPADFSQLSAHEPAAAQEAGELALAQVSSTVSVEGPTGRRPTLTGPAAPKDKLDVALAAIKQVRLTTANDSDDAGNAKPMC